MDLAELKELKTKLEQDILAHIQMLERVSGTSVVGVDLLHSVTIGSEPTKTESVVIEVKL